MGRLLVTALLVTICGGGCGPAVYSNFQTGLGDGGPNASTGGTLDGTAPGRDGAVNFDMTLPPSSGRILAHSSSSSSFVSAVLGADGCTQTAVSGCVLTECPAADMAGAGEIVANDAGTIQIAGGVSTIVLPPQSDGSYLTQTFSTALWPANGGELTVSATGDNYAAFSAIVDAPALVNVANPLATSMPDILRASNYNLDWNNGGAGTVEVAIAAANKTLTCTFVSIDGVSTISPAWPLSTLSAGPGTVRYHRLQRRHR